MSAPASCQESLGTLLIFFTILLCIMQNAEKQCFSISSTCILLRGTSACGLYHFIGQDVLFKIDLWKYLFLHSSCYLILQYLCLETIKSSFCSFSHLKLSSNSQIAAVKTQTERQCCLLQSIRIQWHSSLPIGLNYLSL